MLICLFVFSKSGNAEDYPNLCFNVYREEFQLTRGVG